MTKSGTVNKTQVQNLMHYFLFDPNIYPSLFITLKKKTDIKVEDVKKAVEKAYTQNETTMSKIVLENGEAYFENMPKTGCKVFFDQRNWMDIIHENEKKTFKINEGEFVRTFIIDGKDEIRLLIMAHHIFGDGGSMVLFTQDILSNLAGERVEYKPLNNDNQEPLPKTKYPFLKKLGIKLLNGQWKKVGKTFTWEDYFNVHEQFWKNRKSYIEPVTMTESLAEIKAKSKKLGITINSYITAKALQKNPEYQFIGMPTSTRGTNRSMSNKVAVMRFHFQYNAEKSFEENAKEVHQCIKNSLEDPNKRYFITQSILLFAPTLVDGAFMAHYTGYKNEIAEKMTGLLSMTKENKTHLGITNIGKINLKEEYASFEVNSVVAVAAPMSSTETALAVCTVKDNLSLCYNTVK